MTDLAYESGDVVGLYVVNDGSTLKPSGNHADNLAFSFDGSAWKKTEFTPRPGDMAFHRSYKCEDLTFRGTIEFRSACQQPVSEIMTPAAFHAGLMEELGALTELLDAEAPKLEGGKTPMQLRDLYIRRKLPEDLDAGAASAPGGAGAPPPGAWGGKIPLPAV